MEFVENLLESSNLSSCLLECRWPLLVRNRRIEFGGGLDIICGVWGLGSGQIIPSMIDQMVK